MTHHHSHTDLSEHTPQTLLEQQERENRPSRFVPRTIEVHQDEAEAERARLEHDLNVDFHSADELDARNGIDIIHTEQVMP